MKHDFFIYKEEIDEVVLFPFYLLSDPGYSSTLLQHARDLYNFANNHRAKYSDTFPEVIPFYG